MIDYNNRNRKKMMTNKYGDMAEMSEQTKDAVDNHNPSKVDLNPSDERAIYNWDSPDAFPTGAAGEEGFGTKFHTHEEVWQKLSKIDVGGHTKEKGGLTYLSWAWAWGVLMDNFPDAGFHFFENKVYPDKSVEVSCEVWAGLVHRQMWLPVMDYRNRAIKNPDARAISDAKMRCLTKCIGLLGLGHYIYAGEDLPRQPEPEGEETPAKRSARKAGVKLGNDKPVSDGGGDLDLDNSTEEVAPTGGSSEKIRVIKSTILEFIKDAESVESLREFWKDNQDNLKYLAGKDMKGFTEMKEAFVTKKGELSSE